MLEDFRLGRVGNFFSGVTKKIENLLVTIESQLDFSDEGAVGSMNKENIKKEVFVLKKGLSDFLGKYLGIILEYNFLCDTGYSFKNSACNEFLKPQPPLEKIKVLHIQLFQVGYANRGRVKIY